MRYMKRLKTLLTLLILTMALNSYSQTVNCACDSIYDFAETLPQYQNGVKGLSEFLMTDIAPILSDCYRKDNVLTTSIYLTLTINKEGKVINVDFNKILASEKCKEELREKIITMTSWTPAKQGNIAVCSKYQLPIGCILWK